MNTIAQLESRITKLLRLRSKITSDTKEKECWALDDKISGLMATREKCWNLATKELRKKWNWAVCLPETTRTSHED